MEKGTNRNREKAVCLSSSGVKHLALEGMYFHAYHGCFEEEKKQGNRFRVDVKIKAQVGQAVESDCLEDTVDVQEVYRIVATEMAIPSALIEHVAGRILKALYALDKVEGVEVKVSKCNPPLDGPCETSSISLSL